MVSFQSGGLRGERVNVEEEKPLSLKDVEGMIEAQASSIAKRIKEETGTDRDIEVNVGPVEGGNGLRVFTTGLGRFREQVLVIVPSETPGYEDKKSINGFCLEWTGDQSASEELLEEVKHILKD